MKVVHYEQIEAAAVGLEGAAGCLIRCLIGPEDEAPSFSMRQFEIAPQGYTPQHCHAHEHEVFVLEGDGVVFEGNQQHKFKAGDVIFVEPNEVHQFRNTGASPMRFLCLIPNSATGKAVKVAPECGTE